MAATIKDIAKKAKVSTTAVSIALNNRKGVSDDTRKKILQIAQEMNYRPNLTAKSLISKQSKTIGFVLSNISDPFYPELALGIEEKANAMGYNIILSNTGSSRKREAECIDTLLARGVDGIIFSTVTNDDPNLGQLLETKVPFVVVNRVPLDLPEVDKIDSVIIDSYSGGYIAIEHLYKLGHDNIAIVSGSLNTSTARERTRGARAAMKDLGLKFNPKMVLEGDYDWDTACEAARYILEADPRPTAVFAHDDNMALGIREVVISEGLRVPDDIALVGFDDIGYAQLSGIELTTISQKKYEMGSVATRILVDKIEDKTVSMVNKVVLEAEMIIRRTCGYQIRGYVR